MDAQLPTPTTETGRERPAKLEILRYQTRWGIEMYDDVPTLFRTGKAAATCVVSASSKRASQRGSVDGIAQIPSLDRVGLPGLAAQRGRRIAQSAKGRPGASDEGSEPLVHMLQHSYVDQSPVARRSVSPRFRRYPIPIGRQPRSHRRLDCNVTVCSSRPALVPPLDMKRPTRCS